VHLPQLARFGPSRSYVIPGLHHRHDLGFADYEQSTERTIPVMPSLVADLTQRGADQATMPCGSMTYFWAAPLSKSA